jgi:UDP-N-acetyl-D-mannosaminuronic acid dehydrogenase
MKKARVCVVGLGYIGFPTALFYAESGYQVVGIDLDENVIEDLRNGEIRINEKGLDEKASKYLSGIELFSEYKDLKNIDIYVLCLPSPIDVKYQPNLEYLESSLSTIASMTNTSTLIIIESTVPVGFTESQANLFAENSSSIHDKDFWFAHSPERVLPGSVVSEMEENQRLIGGVSQKATNLASAFLGSVFGPDKIQQTKSRISETSKLAENAYRDTCIAFANELARISTELEVDVRDVIRFANMHPRVDILEPGLGVGGYCFPKDGWILVNSTSKTKGLAELIPSARSVNDYMPQHTLRRLKKELGEEYLNITSIGIVGISYKPNVNDTRMSPSLSLIDLLKAENIQVQGYDPFVSNSDSIRMTNNLDELVNSNDVVIFAVNHDGLESKLLSFDLSEKIIVDPTGALKEHKDKFRAYVGLTV